MTDEWIWIVGWERFQHYKHRNPAWVKNHVELLSKDEYLALTYHQRGLLHGLWLAYPLAHSKLRFSVKMLNSKLGATAKIRDYEALVHAGFIEVVASSVLAERYQAASELLASRAPARSRETETEKDLYPGVGLDNGRIQQPPDFNIPNLKPIPDESEAW